MARKMPNYILPRREKTEIERSMDALVGLTIATGQFDTVMQQLRDNLNAQLAGMFGIPESYIRQREDIIEGKARVVSTSWDLQPDQPKLLGPGETDSSQ